MTAKSLFGGNSTNGYDPLVKALLDRLPEAGSYWSEPDRQRWLRIMEESFGLIYTDKPVQAVGGSRALTSAI